jgi:hypothetical protein
MHLMNYMLHPFIDSFVIIYLDDILIFSSTWEEHIIHRPYTHLQTWTKSNPLSVSLEAQCLSSSPLSPRLELLPSRLTPREAKGGRP